MKYILILSVILGLGYLSTGPMHASVVTPPTDVDSTQSDSLPPSLIDYDGFNKLVDDVDSFRQTRLVSPTKFMQMSKDSNTIILDTRSKLAYDQLHVEGAVHLNFSDFTADKLKKYIPSTDTRILIYCNNNFLDNVMPYVGKGMPLALNIPTFINLVGYGYTNVYELQNAIWIDNDVIPMEGSMKSQLIDNKVKIQPVIKSAPIVEIDKKVLKKE